MNKLMSCLLAMIFLISGCTFNVQILTLEPPPATPTLLYTATSPAPSIPTTVSPTVEPTFTPVPPTTYPVFTNARVGASPDDPNRPTFFPAGTKAVYAIWDYQNMRDGLMVRREW